MQSVFTIMCPPARYDKDFWDNLLHEDLGGTDVVDVMCSGGDVEGFRLDEYGIEGNPSECLDPNGDLLSDNRDLRDVDDEEFEIPALYDDIEYEREPIPDLERDDGEQVYVGKLYASKEDYQIRLAIYAIRNMFHYKQAVTKRESFMCNCCDARCEWKIYTSGINRECLL